MEQSKTYEALGADFVYTENLQSNQEYERMQSSLKGEALTILVQLQLYLNDEDQQRCIQGAPYMIDDNTVGVLQGVAQEFFANKWIVPSHDDNTEVVCTMTLFKE
eukprot:9691445-Ditylum_brightwellii.AAC.1